MILELLWNPLAQPIIYLTNILSMLLIVATKAVRQIGVAASKHRFSMKWESGWRGRDRRSGSGSDAVQSGQFIWFEAVYAESRVNS